MANIETIVTNCIEEIRSGRATLAECLNQYPSRQQELEPLLRIALNIKQPPVFKLGDSYKLVVKNRLLEQIEAEKQKKSKSFTDVLSFGLPLQFAWAKIAVSALVLVIIISMLAGATAYAAQNSLPGNLLYAVKKGIEDARLLTASQGLDKVELNLEFAQARLVELNKLATGKAGKTDYAINGYRDNLNAARQEIQVISNNSHLSDILDRALDTMQNQIVFCDTLIDSNQAYSEPFRKASNVNISEQVQLLKIVQQQNILRAAQLNLNIMQNRLLRALAKANNNQYQTMQEVLLQYQQFNQVGQQILQLAQTEKNFNVEIEQLSLEALAGYMNILDNISKEVPKEYFNSVEDCRLMTEQFQIQAAYGNLNQEKSGISPQESIFKKDNSNNTDQDTERAPQNQEQGINTEDSNGSGSGGGTGSGGSTGSGGGTGSSGGNSGNGK